MLAVTAGGSTTFQLSDAKKNVRMSAAVKSDGSPILSFKDESGLTRVEIFADGPGNSSTLSFADEKSKIRAALLTSGGAASLYLSDEAGTPRTSLRVESEGAPALSLNDEKGNLRANLGTLADGSPILSLLRAGGTGSAVLGTSANGNASLTLFGGSSNARLWLGVHKDDSPALYLKDEKGGTKGSFACDPTNPRLKLFDSAGEVLWQVP